MSAPCLPMDTLADLTAVERVPIEERGIALTTYDLLVEAARSGPDAEAVVVLPDPGDIERAVSWTFAELCDLVERIARGLASLGVGRDDAVTLLAPNTGHLLASTLAAQAVGIVAPVNPAFEAVRIKTLLRTTGSRHVVAAGPELDPALWERLTGAAADLGLEALIALRPDGLTGAPPRLAPVDGVRVMWLEELIEGVAPGPLGELAPGPDDLAAFFHTGGTTGDPKVAAHTHRNEATTAWGIAACAQMSPGETVLAGLPLFHVNAVLVTVLAPLVRGGRVLWPGPLGYRAPALYGSFWHIVERYRVVSMSAVPTVYAVLTQVPVDADISTLTYPAVGAAPLPDAVRTAFRDHTGLDLHEGYGLTEATCASAVTPRGQVRPGSVGRRLPYQRIDVDESGELLIAGPAVFAGYVHSTAEGRRLVTEGSVVDGWLRTGDLGSVDEDGFVRLSGRSKDLIIRGGHNIDPRVIEEALLTHPDVADAGAVGRPDDHAGEVPVAFVALRAGAETTTEELLAWAAEHIDEPAARPKSVTVLDTLPVTAVGKPFKPALRELAARQTAGR